MGEKGKIFSVSLNLAAILAFVSFWTYGFFGALSSGGSIANFLIFSTLFAIFILFLFLWQKGNPLFKFVIAFGKRDVLVFVALLVVLFPFSFPEILQSLVNDGLAHAQQSVLHAMSFIYLASGGFDFLNTFKFSTILWVVNILILLSALIGYKLIKSASFGVKIAVFTFVFASSRLLVLYLGGSGSPHPPFRLFPLWLSSTILFPSDFSFRFAQFAGLLAMGWFIQRMSEKKVGFSNSVFLALACVSIPVLWHAGVIVEASLWASFAWIFTLLYIFSKKELFIGDYVRLFAIISVFTLMRQTAFLALIPVFIQLAFDIKEKKIHFSEVPLLLSPTLIMLPFLLSSFFFGTSASYIPGEVAFIPAGASGLLRVWYALHSGMVWVAAKNSIGLIWLIFGLCAFIFSIHSARRFLGLTFLLIGSIIVFYLVRPGLWGIGRYQAEYIIPFVIIGLFQLSVFLLKKKISPRIVLTIGLCVLITWNIFVFKGIPSKNPPIDLLKENFSEEIKKSDGYFVLSEFPYDYRKALIAVKDSGYAEGTYIAGSTYGVFPQILNGFTVKEVIASKALFGDSSSLRSGTDSLNPEEINSKSGIKLVLISDIYNSETFSFALKEMGWTEWKKFENMRYSSTIIGFIRN